MISCQFVEVDFFTAKHPAQTPEFCGCILRFVGYQYDGVVTRDQIKSCYIEALQDGPMPKRNQNGRFNRVSFRQFNDYDFIKGNRNY